jgi:hypothetical protein
MQGVARKDRLLLSLIQMGGAVATFVMFGNNQG